VTLLTLISFYVNLLEPSDFMVGLFYTGFTLAQSIVVIPIALAGDRYDMRLLLLGVIATNALSVPFTPAVGIGLGLPKTYPILGALSPVFLPLVGLNGLLGVADAFREPASMALEVATGNDRALAFYEKLGFEPNRYTMTADVEDS
jgi:MFS family permease